jgi:hypothetical protein
MATLAESTGEYSPLPRFLQKIAGAAQRGPETIGKNVVSEFQSN